MVGTQCTLREVAWLWSRASNRGSYSHGTLPSYIIPGGDLAPSDQVLSDWVSGAQFPEVLAYSFRQHQDIRGSCPQDLGYQGCEKPDGVEDEPRPLA